MPPIVSQFLDHHESDSPLIGTGQPRPPGTVASVPLSAASNGPAVTPSQIEPEPTDLAEPCHTQASSLADGLHLKSERTPREDYAIPPLLTGEALFRHSGWRRQRQQTWEAMQRTNSMSMANYRFANCGSGAWIQVSAGGDKARCVCNCCHHRLCVPCQRAVGRTVRQNLVPHMKGKTVRFVTLTLRHNHNPLAAQITRLLACWSTLRRRKDIAPLFTGGVAVLETKVSDRDGLWHVHLHIIAEGSFVDQKQLAAAWYAITGDSSIVDVRAVGEQDKAAEYLTKYISKPIDASLYASPKRLDEYIIAITGRKTVSTFGTWRGLKLKARPKDDTVWKSQTSLLEFKRLLRSGDPWAKAVLMMLEPHQEPLPQRREPGDDADSP